MEIVKNQKRNIDVVTAEIKSLCLEARHMMLIYAIEIGRRLVEAKDILPHGEWGDWLRNEVEFSQSTANKHMKLFEKFGARQISLLGAELNSETFTNLTYSQALKLISVPDEELEDFVKDNDIEHKSVREIERLVKERDAAAEKAAAAEQKLNEFLEEAKEIDGEKSRAESIAEERERELERERQNAEDLRNSIREMKQELENAQREVEEYRKRAEEPSLTKEQTDKLKAEITAKMKEEHAEELKAAIEKAEKKLNSAKNAQQKAEKAAAAADSRADEESAKNRLLQEQVDKLRNELAKSRNEELVRVNILFENTQRYIDKMNILLDGVPDGNVYRGKIRDTLCSMLELTAE